MLKLREGALPLDGPRRSTFPPHSFDVHVSCTCKSRAAHDHLDLPEVVRGAEKHCFDDPDRDPMHECRSPELRRAQE